MGKKATKKVEYIRHALEAKTEAQAHYIISMQNNIITFGLGSSGTGKTYCSVAYAADLLDTGQVRRIIVTRPAVESGRGMGFLPGTLEEKFSPYLVPLEDTFVSRYGRGWYECQIKNGNILPVPLEYMQGRTFDDAFVLADEMQNSTPLEMFMLLSRTGEYSKVVINGDPRMQKMIKGNDGLSDAVKRLSGLSSIGVVEFTSEDVVRSGIAGEIIARYEQTDFN